MYTNRVDTGGNPINEIDVGNYPNDYEISFKIISDLEILKKILGDLIEWNIKNSFFPIGLIVSPLLGKGGSIEFLIHLRIDKEFNFNFEDIIEKVFRDVKEITSK